MGKCPIILVSVVRVLFPPFPKRRIAALTGYWRIRVTMYVVLVDMLTYWLWSFFLALLFSCQLILIALQSYTWFNMSALTSPLLLHLGDWVMSKDWWRTSLDASAPNTSKFSCFFLFFCHLEWAREQYDELFTLRRFPPILSDLGNTVNYMCIREKSCVFQG